LLIAKNNEIKSLIDTNARTKNTYEAQANAYRRTIESLEKQLSETERDRDDEFQSIKKKYDQLSQNELSNLKHSHTNEI
jgi:predicted nuclease with TOPRIM domain